MLQLQFNQPFRKWLLLVPELQGDLFTIAQGPNREHRWDFRPRPVLGLWLGKDAEEGCSLPVSAIDPLLYKESTQAVFS